jgi:arginine decarboxylase
MDRTLDFPHESSAPTPDTDSTWSIDQSRELYRIDTWANEFFGISEDGEVEVYLEEGEHTVALSLREIIAGCQQRGMEVPILLRFRDLLAARIRKLNSCFEEAISKNGYRGKYRGVFPIKVNQQKQVIEEITRYGRQYHFGLEAGSKAELLAAMAYMHDPEAYLICNGYKDSEFVDLALCGLKMGLQVFLVIEMPGELELILKRAARMGVKPLLGLRSKLATRNDGRWSHSSGERSVFGLTADQTIRVVDTLRKVDRLDCLQLLHYHQGSQIPDIRAIRDAAMEASRIYVELAREGAPMRLLDIGGGLAVDYDGSQSKTSSSRNYGMLEYAADVVEIVMAVCDQAGQPHPDIISESGRSIAAYYSVLVFNVLDVNRYTSHVHTTEFPSDANVFLKNLQEVDDALTDENLQECYNDAVYYRGELLSLFDHGQIPLRERAYADSLYWHIMSRILGRLQHMEDVPEELADLSHDLHDVYYGNFSLFQSLPDAWAIDQVFPVMPIHRLDQRPTSSAILADITCDCDGRLDDFLVDGERRSCLPLHCINDGEEYLVGVFLVGAYQETLGDLHNLLGDTNMVSIGVMNGKPSYISELAGDSVADVLSYVRYNPKRLIERFRRLAEQAVQDNAITVAERREMLAAYQESIHGYTYFEIEAREEYASD